MEAAIPVAREAAWGAVKGARPLTRLMNAVAGYPMTRGDAVERHAREVRWEMDGRRLAKPSSMARIFGRR